MAVFCEVIIIIIDYWLLSGLNIDLLIHVTPEFQIQLFVPFTNWNQVNAALLWWFTYARIQMHRPTPSTMILSYLHTFHSCHLNKTLPKAQRTRGLSSSCQSNLESESRPRFFFINSTKQNKMLNKLQLQSLAWTSTSTLGLKVWTKV